MNVKQAYFDFLATRGAKQKIQAIVKRGIEEWKQHPAYYYDAERNDPGDYSGDCLSVLGKTIGDIAKTDIEVLKAFTGDWEASYTSHYGKNWLRVKDKIEWDIRDCLSNLRGNFIMENADELFKEYDIEREDDWEEMDIIEVLDEAMAQNDWGLTIDWMMAEMPEYKVDDEDMPGTDYLFWINE